MTPEEKQQFEQMMTELSAVRQELDSLKNASTIPYEYDASFRSRLGIDAFATGLTTSSKSATSETIAVNSGTSTLVQLAPDGFLRVTIDGTVYDIPAFT